MESHSIRYMEKNAMDANIVLREKMMRVGVLRLEGYI